MEAQLLGALGGAHDVGPVGEGAGVGEVQSELHASGRDDDRQRVEALVALRVHAVGARSLGGDVDGGGRVGLDGAVDPEVVDGQVLNGAGAVDDRARARVA